MAKVGRASRNASKMRVESLHDGTANKTIASSETGELYLLAGDPHTENNYTSCPKGRLILSSLLVLKQIPQAGRSSSLQAVMLGSLLAHVNRCYYRCCF